jgi:hypothetical protein
MIDSETKLSERASRLTIIELVALLASLALLVGGVGRHMPELLVIAGLLLLLVGGLAWVERRLTLSGPSGELRRKALGRARVVRLQLRASLWLLLGALVLLWGIVDLTGAAPYRKSEADHYRRGSLLLTIRSWSSIA